MRCPQGLECSHDPHSLTQPRRRKTNARSPTDAISDSLVGHRQRNPSLVVMSGKGGDMGEGEDCWSNGGDVGWSGSGPGQAQQPAPSQKRKIVARNPKAMMARRAHRMPRVETGRFVRPREESICSFDSQCPLTQPRKRARKTTRAQADATPDSLKGQAMVMGGCDGGGGEGGGGVEG